jgi:hypothetical protein
VSIDDRYVALACQRGDSLDAIVYDIAADEIAATRTFAGSWDSLDWVSVSQSGNYVVFCWGSSGGVDVYDIDLDNQRHLFDKCEHGDLGFDSGGNETYVQVCPVQYARLDNGAVTDMLLADYSWAWYCGHISCRNIDRPGWCYVSDMDREEVFGLRIDETDTVERFAHHRSTAASYEAEVQAVANGDGNKVLFASDWGGGEINSYVTEMPCP